MEDKTENQIYEEQTCQTEACEKAAESSYKTRSLYFERQPTRYAWFVLDPVQGTNDWSWKKTRNHNIRQINQMAGDVPEATVTKLCHSNTVNSSVKRKHVQVDSENIKRNHKLRGEKKNIKKINDDNPRKKNKRIHTVEDTDTTAAISGQKNISGVKSKINEETVLFFQDYKKIDVKELEVKGSMEQKDSSHKKNNVSYLENDDVKSSNNYEDYIGGKNDTEHYTTISGTADPKDKKSISPTDINKSSNKNNKNSLFLEAEVEIPKNCEIFEPTENRIFGRATDQLRSVNTEAVKFSFGSCTTENPHEETLVASERDIYRNQNEADSLKQNVSKLRKYEEDSRKSVANIFKGSSDRVEPKENIITRTEHHSEIKEICNSESEMAANETKLTTVSSTVDTSFQNGETICKTCLAIQAAEKRKHENMASTIGAKYDSLSMGIFTDYFSKESEKNSSSQKIARDTLYETLKTYQSPDDSPKRKELPGEDKTLTEKLDENITETSLNHTISVLSGKTEAKLCQAPLSTEYQEQQHLMTNTFAKQHVSLQQRASSSSENSEFLEDESLDSIEAQAPEQKEAAKKHRHGWFSRLFSRLRRKKIETSS